MHTEEILLSKAFKGAMNGKGRTARTKGTATTPKPAPTPNPRQPRTNAKDRVRRAPKSALEALSTAAGTKGTVTCVSGILRGADMTDRDASNLFYALRRTEVLTADKRRKETYHFHPERLKELLANVGKTTTSTKTTVRSAKKPAATRTAQEPTADNEAEIDEEIETLRSELHALKLKERDRLRAAIAALKQRSR
jgi:Sec-independent protein translocase protein TatA